MGALVKRKPAVAIVGGAAALVGIVVLMKKGSPAASSAADTGTQVQPGTIDPSLYGTPSDLGGAQDYLGNTDASQIEAQLTGLQGQLAALSAAETPAGPPPPIRGGVNHPHKPKKPPPKFHVPPPRRPRRR